MILSLGNGSSITLVGTRPNIVKEDINAGITLKSSASNTIIFGNDNVDSIVTTGVGDNYIYNKSGNNVTIISGNGNDTILAGAGDDYFKAYK